VDAPVIRVTIDIAVTDHARLLAMAREREVLSHTLPGLVLNVVESVVGLGSLEPLAPCRAYGLTLTGYAEARAVAREAP
jgi:hypothetical protein